ncbi:MAG: aminoacetone oxidase family FAD-binding enzyme [Flavobacteriales bacterium]|nr:MAG: aminoacetone oxidase family FAD-binding enzyme [Flavobacteriales bacterium]
MKILPTAKLNNPTYDVIIIGGGAAGIFAAINIGASNPNLKIVVLEKTTKLLSKVKVSGGGRCNVTHACFDPKELVKYYPRGEKELLGPFHQFQPGDTIAWFADRGIELKIEDDGRMFPISNDSQTIIDCFLKEIEKYNIDIRYQSAVETINHSENAFNIQLQNGALTCNNLIIATGGFHKVEGYDFMKNLKHTIIPPNPSLFTFNLPKNDLLSLQGLVSEVEIKILGSKFIDQGPLLVTHWGVSGPAVLKLSSWAARLLNEKNYEFDFMINWLPNHNETSLKELFNSYKQNFGNKKVFNQLELDVPKKLKHFLLEKSNISSDLKWADVNKKQINKLIQLLTADIYPSKGKTTFKQEFVSCGGVKLNEINFKTMESKLVPKLYFAGEVLNIDALTGGFNFQNAWTTSWIAAQRICSE